MSKSGVGTLILNGNSEYRGTTTITGGTVQMNGTNRAFFWNGSAMVFSNSGAVTVTNANLLVNGSLTGETTVQSSAKLGGSGTVNTVSGGILAPGNSPGLLTATNGLSMATGSTFEWELIGNTVAGRGTNYDAVNVTGGNTFDRHRRSFIVGLQREWFDGAMDGQLLGSQSKLVGF